MKNVLISGGNGFLGSNLAWRLIDSGVNVSVITLPGEDQRNLHGLEGKIEVIEKKLGPEIDLREILKRKDTFFHFAWQTNLSDSLKHPNDDLQQDVGGVINILESCRRYNPGMKLVFPSTATIVGVPKSLPVDENHAEAPCSPYDINKLAAEKYFRFYAQQYGVRSTCLRLANVFGERQRIDNPHRGILNFFIGRVMRGEDILIYGDGNLIRDYSYIQNFVDAFINSAEFQATDGQVYSLGSGTGLSFNVVAEEIQRLALEIYGKQTAIKHVPSPESAHPINTRNFIGDPTKFKKDTGWSPKVDFKEGLKRTMEFYKHV